MALTDRQRKIQWLKDIAAGRVSRQDLIATHKAVQMNYGDRTDYFIDDIKVSQEEYERTPKSKRAYNVTMLI